ncbi:MAG: alpha/beta hydrolase [Bacteroidota bacterium]|nr:alpha/beta hydrolase [Bacteroidota bacterium]
MKKIFLLLFSMAALASCKKDPVSTPSEPGVRYRDPIFSQVTFETVVNPDLAGMDIYQPAGDTASQRPVVIFVHGGAFVSGFKGQPAAVEFCTQMAKRGYVAVSISYYLKPSMTFVDSVEILETVFKALSDTKESIRFLRHTIADQGNPYRIDEDRIYGAGNSAGGILVVQAGYMDEDEVTTFPLDSIMAANGGIEGTGLYQEHSSELAGVINLCGGIKSTTWLDADEPPIVSFHGEIDNVVPYDCGTILSGLSGGTNVLRICGSGSLHPVATSVGIRSELYSYPTLGHSPWVDQNGQPNSLMLEVIQKAAEFLYSL